MKKLLTFTLITASAALMTACSSSGVNIEKQTPGFQLGAKDGCATATGEYTKNSNSFQQDMDYQNGWFHGRKKCNPQMRHSS